MALNQATLVLCVLLSFYSTVAVAKSFVYFPGSHSVAVGKTIDFRTCAKGKADISSVDVNPCPKEPCVFKKGTTVNTTVTFTPKEQINGGKLEIFGIVGSFKIRLPLDQPHICKDHNLKCPLEAGKEAKFFLSLVVENYFPPVPLKMQADVKDEKGQMIICIQFKAKISN